MNKQPDFDKPPWAIALGSILLGLLGLLCVVAPFVLLAFLETVGSMHAERVRPSIAESLKRYYSGPMLVSTLALLLVSGLFVAGGMAMFTSKRLARYVTACLLGSTVLGLAFSLAAALLMLPNDLVLTAHSLLNHIGLASAVLWAILFWSILFFKKR